MFGSEVRAVVSEVRASDPREVYITNVASYTFALNCILSHVHYINCFVFCRKNANNVLKRTQKVTFPDKLKNLIGDHFRM